MDIIPVIIKDIAKTNISIKQCIYKYTISWNDFTKGDSGMLSVPSLLFFSLIL